MKQDNYEDIINLPHHVSKIHRQMPMYQRAAQFAPFAALVGYKEAIDRAVAESAASADDFTALLSAAPDPAPVTPAGGGGEGQDALGE